MSAKLNILCLHGYAQSAEFFRARTGALRKALKSVADFHFIDAPHEATAEFLGDAPEERGARLGWFNPGENSPGARPAISSEYVGAESALERVRLAIETDGPFDGVLGFSQGATLAAFCCLRPDVWCCAGQSPFRFAILVSAFAPLDPGWALAAPTGMSKIPSFHCYGLADPSVPPESSQRVAANFVSPVMHEHEGGHGVPSDARLRAALKQFLADIGGGTQGEAAPPKGGAKVLASASSDKAGGVMRSHSPQKHALAEATDSFIWAYTAWRALRCSP